MMSTIRKKRAHDTAAILPSRVLFAVRVVVAVTVG